MPLRFILLLALAPIVPCGEVFLTKKEALELAFEGCEVTRSVVVLSDEQREAVGKLSGEKPDQRLVYPYVATKDGEVVGTAWFDAHEVRTFREVLMFVVDPEGKIERLEVLAFGEPKEFIPRTSWYAQFLDRKLDEELSLGKAIKPVTGATLTARATTDAARRVLAIHQVWNGGEPEPKPDPEPPEDEEEDEEEEEEDDDEEKGKRPS